MTASQKHRSQIVFKRLLESRAMFQQNLVFGSKVLWIQFLCDILPHPHTDRTQHKHREVLGRSSAPQQGRVHTAGASQAEAVNYGPEMFSSREGNRVTSSIPSELHLVLPCRLGQYSATEHAPPPAYNFPSFVLLFYSIPIYIYSFSDKILSLIRPLPGLPLQLQCRNIFH